MAHDTIAVPARVLNVMGMLTAAAENGRECPTNIILAAGAGCSKGNAIGAIALLETMGVIDVKRGRDWRVVTISATGKSTKDTARPPKAKVAKPSNRGFSEQARASANASRGRARRERIALFCDALSEGETIRQAGRVAGVSEQSAHSMLRTVREELGWQAQ